MPKYYLKSTNEFQPLRHAKPNVMEQIERRLRVEPNTTISLQEYNAKCTGDYTKETAKKQLKQNKKDLAKLQYKFYATNKYSMLIVLQAMDAAGKDGAIKHVMSGINPQGCLVHSFKKPSVNELEHDFLWRHFQKLPERGHIGIFNRSHYENVLVTKVHPEYLLAENLPNIRTIEQVNDKFWQERYKRINTFEEHLYQSGTIIVKFFLHLSKEEQRNRFLSRIDTPEKNWKFSEADINERKYWDDYQRAFEMMLSKTSKKHAPWYIIPADNKWFSRIAISDIIIATLKKLKLKIPKLSTNEQQMLNIYKQQLEQEL